MLMNGKEIIVGTVLFKKRTSRLCASYLTAHEKYKDFVEVMVVTKVNKLTVVCNEGKYTIAELTRMGYSPWREDVVQKTTLESISFAVAKSIVKGDSLSNVVSLYVKHKATRSELKEIRDKTALLIRDYHKKKELSGIADLDGFLSSSHKK